jgi:predicted deacylase
MCGGRIEAAGEDDVTRGIALHHATDAAFHKLAVVTGLMRELDTATLAGTVVALPILNITAFRSKIRMSPFEGFAGGDLNRAFPGKADGTLTEQMAHAIYAELKAHATHLVDLHTAMTADVRWALFPAAPGEVGTKSESMARAFGFNSTLPAPMDILGGSAMMVAARDGIPGLIVERAKARRSPRSSCPTSSSACAT